MAGNVVNFSVGTCSADLKSGTPSITISGGIATFSIPQMHPGLGAGDDVLITGGTHVYLKNKVAGSSSVWVVTDAVGLAPADIPATEVQSITRCFSYLADALSVTGIAGKIGTLDLTVANVYVIINCFSDYRFGYSVDAQSVLGTNYITSSVNSCYITVTSPSNILFDCNVRQGHTGTPGSGYYLRADSGVAPIIDIREFMVVLNQLDIVGTATTGIKISSSTSVDPSIQRVQRCIIRNTGDYGIWFAQGISDRIEEAYCVDNVVYDQVVSQVKTSANSVYMIQSTVYGGQTAVEYELLPVNTNHWSWMVSCGHSSSDLAGVLPDVFKYSFGEDVEFGSIPGNRRITGSLLGLFQDISGSNRDFRVPTTSVLYNAWPRELSNLEILTPDLTGVYLPRADRVMNVGAYSVSSPATVYPTNPIIIEDYMRMPGIICQTGMDVSADLLNNMQGYQATELTERLTDLVGYAGFAWGIRIAKADGALLTITKGVGFDQRGVRLELTTNTTYKVAAPNDGSTSFYLCMRMIYAPIKYKNRQYDGVRLPVEYATGIEFFVESTVATTQDNRVYPSNNIGLVIAKLAKAGSSYTWTDLDDSTEGTVRSPRIATKNGVL